MTLTPRPPIPTPGCSARLVFGPAAPDPWGLIVDALVTEASGTAERDAALALLGRQPGRHLAALGADKAYDSADFVAELWTRNVTPHIAQNTRGRRSAIDARTTRHPGYGVSQRRRKRIE